MGRNLRVRGISVMKKGLFRIIAAGVIVSFVVMESCMSVKATDGWYSGENFDEYLESFYRRMAEEGYPVKDSGYSSSEDAKVAHPTQEPTPTQESTQNQEPEQKQHEQKKREPVKTCDHVYESKVTKEPTCAEEGEQ